MCNNQSETKNRIFFVREKINFEISLGTDRYGHTFQLLEFLYGDVSSSVLVKWHWHRVLIAHGSIILLPTVLFHSLIKKTFLRSPITQYIFDGTIFRYAIQRRIFSQTLNFFLTFLHYAIYSRWNFSIHDLTLNFFQTLNSLPTFFHHATYSRWNVSIHDLT